MSKNTGLNGGDVWSVMAHIPDQQKRDLEAAMADGSFVMPGMGVIGTITKRTVTPWALMKMEKALEKASKWAEQMQGIEDSARAFNRDLDIPLMANRMVRDQLRSHEIMKPHPRLVGSKTGSERVDDMVKELESAHYKRFGEAQQAAEFRAAAFQKKHRLKEELVDLFTPQRDPVKTAAEDVGAWERLLEEARSKERFWKEKSLEPRPSIWDYPYQSEAKIPASRADTETVENFLRESLERQKKVKGD
jgi:hypothetical protein